MHIRVVNLAAKTSRLPTYSGLASVLRDLGLCKYSILYDFGAFQFYIGKSSRSHILGEDGHPSIPTTVVLVVVGKAWHYFH